MCRSVQHLRSAGSWNLQERPALSCLQMVGQVELNASAPAFIPSSVHTTLSERACAKAYTSVQPRACTSAPATACISLGLGKCVYTQPPVDLNEDPLLARPLACLGGNNEGLLVVPWRPCNITKTQTPRRGVQSPPGHVAAIGVRD